MLRKTEAEREIPSLVPDRCGTPISWVCVSTMFLWRKVPSHCVSTQSKASRLLPALNLLSLISVKFLWEATQGKRQLEYPALCHLPSLPSLRQWRCSQVGALET